MQTKTISTENAPAAIGTYSQAVQAGNTLYISGQIAINPATGEMQNGIDAQIEQVFTNLQNICLAAGATLNNVVKVNVFLTDLANFGKVNAAMEKFFQKPYPARAAVQVSKLPKDALVEADAIAVVD